MSEVRGGEYDLPFQRRQKQIFLLLRSQREKITVMAFASAKRDVDVDSGQEAIFSK